MTQQGEDRFRATTAPGRTNGPGKPSVFAPHGAHRPDVQPLYNGEMVESSEPALTTRTLGANRVLGRPRRQVCRLPGFRACEMKRCRKMSLFVGPGKRF